MAVLFVTLRCGAENDLVDFFQLPGAESFAMHEAEVLVLFRGRTSMTSSALSSLTSVVPTTAVLLLVIVFVLVVVPLFES